MTVTTDPTPLSAPAAPAESEAAAGGGPRLRRGRRIVVGMALAWVTAVVIGAVFASVLAADPDVRQDLSAAFSGPGRDHLLGTDHLGRDMLSRLLFGARTSLWAVAYALPTVVMIGGVPGLIAGYAGGWWDRVVGRLADAVLALPGLLLVIAIVAGLGPNLRNAMVALGIVLSPVLMRVVRSAVLLVRKEPYVDAARVLGYGTPRILVRHIIPNIAPVLVTQLAILTSVVLLAEASLSFLGLGVQPPDTSWGLMLKDASTVMRISIWPVVPPGVAITLSVLAVSVLAEASQGGHTAPAVRAARSSQGERHAWPATEPPVRPAGDLVLDVSDLRVHATDPQGGLVELVSGVDLAVERGTTLALIGESGCGKTVTALALMRLLTPSVKVEAATLRIAGHDARGLSDRAFNALRGTEVAMIFQEPTSSLDPAYTIVDQVAEARWAQMGESRRQARRHAVELLELVGITDAADRAKAYPHQISGGMAQRVSIAMALSCGPSLLIADEPTTALDVTVQAGILDLLRDVREKTGLSMVIVTHNVGVVADIADSVAVMYAGQIVEMGAVKDVLLRPKHPYTQALLASMPENVERTGPLTSIPGRVPPPWDWPAACRFAPRCPRAGDVCRAGPIDLVPIESSIARCVRLDAAAVEGGVDVER